MSRQNVGGAAVDRAATEAELSTGPDGAETRLLTVLLVVVGVLLLLQVGRRSELGNGDYYLRNARAYLDGSVAHSRYSPGFGLFLVPVVWVAGHDLGSMTLLGDLLMVLVALLGLFLLHRLLGIYLSPGAALGVMAWFALGQACATFLVGVEVEPLALCLVSGSLLASARGRSWWAVALGALAMLTRVALAPFFTVLWLLFLIRRRVAPALTGLASVAIGMAAHLASGPTVDESYVAIGGSAYGADRRAPGDSALAYLARSIGERVVDYLHYGVPRLVVPFRALDVPLVGPLLALCVLGAVGFGLLRLHRRRQAGRDRWWTFSAAITASAVLLVALLLWPVRAGESTRLLMPVTAIPLLGLGSALEWVLGWATSQPRRRLLALVAGLSFVVTAASTASLLWDRRTPRSDERNFIAAHKAIDGFPPGPILSRKPGYSELAARRPAFAYPTGEAAVDLERVSAKTRACTLVIDELGAFSDEVLSWVRVHGEQVIAAAGATRIVTISAPWCQGGHRATGAPG